MSETVCWALTGRRARKHSWIPMTLPYVYHLTRHQLHCPAVNKTSNNIPGHSLQPLDRPRPALHLCHLPRHHFHLVGAVAREHLRLSSGPAHQRLWLLRLLLHHPHRRRAVMLAPLLLRPQHGHARLSNASHRLPLGECHHHCQCPAHSC
jgi:hypothetical protein